MTTLSADHSKNANFFREIHSVTIHEPFDLQFAITECRHGKTRNNRKRKQAAWLGSWLKRNVHVCRYLHIEKHIYNVDA